MIPLLRRNRTTLGLDVGSGFVKAVVVDHSGAEPVLTHAGYLPLVADAIVEGEIMDPPLVAETIRSLVGSLGVQARTVATAVGGRDVIIKKIQMDRMAPEDAREVIRWEAEQYVPFDMANVQLDFQILDPDADGLQMSVLLVAAKRELVEQRVMLLREAGLSPAVVDVDAFALYNALEINYPDATRGVVAMVNVGNEISTTLVMQDGAPVITNDVPFGARHLREELRRMRGLTADEADAVLHGRSDRAREFQVVLRDRCDELAMGVERAVAFRGIDEGLDRRLATVYLSGGAARIPQLAEAIGERLRARVEVVNPLQRLRIHPTATVHLPGEELAPMLMLPVGLALRTAA